jgi:cytochrome c biogenesis protein CcdA
VGPTLGAASLMASRGENLGAVTAVTIVFALGAAAPLLLLGLLSRKAWVSWSGRFAKIGSAGKLVAGIILIVVGLLAVTGLDRAVQSFLVSISPAWLTALTTSI